MRVERSSDLLTIQQDEFDYFAKGSNARRRKREMDILTAMVPGFEKVHKKREPSVCVVDTVGEDKLCLDLLNMLVEEHVRELVESRVPSLREVIANTSFTTGRDMALGVPWKVRLNAQQLSSSDDEAVKEIWSSVTKRSGEAPEWWDRQTVSEAPSYPKGIVKVTRKDLCTISPQSWLNDEVINMYMMLLVARSQDEALGYPRLHAVSTHWLTKLTSQGTYNYSSVKRWTRTVDVFSKDILLIPVNFGGSHWTLAYVNFPLEKIVYCDSLGSIDAGQRVTNAIRRWLCDEYKERKKIERGWEEMKLYPGGDTQIPRQNNSYDCGVFTCSFANCVSAGRGFEFSQSDMPYLRKRIVVELLEARVPIPI